MSNTEKKDFRNTMDVMSEVEDALVKVNELPDVIQLLIENLNLDMKETTPSEALELVSKKNMIYNVLTLVQRNIYEMLEEIEAINVTQDKTTNTDQND